MQHHNLVTMIDACLERLQAARQLLSSPHDSSALGDLKRASEGRIAKTKKKVRPAIATKKKRRDELTASLFDATAVIEAIVPVQRPSEPRPGLRVVVAPRQVIVAAPRVRSTRPKAVPPPRGLALHVPSGPVFIPAAQVRKEVAEKQTGSLAERTAKQAGSAPLTAELLAQRWIQSADL